MEIYQKNEIIAKFMGYTDDQIQAEEWCGCNIMEYCEYLEEGRLVSADYHNNIYWLYPVWLFINDLYIKGEPTVDSAFYLTAKIALLSGNINSLHNLLFQIITKINNDE